MRVVLAGYNLDVTTLRELRAFIERFVEAVSGSGWDAEREIPPLLDTAKALLARDNLTPETLSAAYARVSRDPRPVDELRSAARLEVEKARRSNQGIIFGLGHSSVAEHAVFNLDLIGVSRLVVEDVERSRLVSYTEKSQRYVRLEDDFVFPGEIAGSPLAAAFTERIRAQAALYRRLLERLMPPEAGEAGPEEAARRRAQEGRAKEDARYATSMSTAAQLGMTANARSLEGMILRLAASPLGEARELSRALHEAVRGVAPSLVKYTEPGEFERRTGTEVSAAARAALADAPPAAREREPVVLVAATPEADRRLVAAILHGSTARAYEDCWQRAGSMSAAGREQIVKAATRRMESWHPALREFEHISATFEMIVSASCFAQLKRHRMATLTVQPYDPGLGVTVPESVRDAGMEREFLEEAGNASELHAALSPLGAPAAYALTNAHRRRVLFTANAREIYHLSRLREDAHAQWDIRAIASKAVAAARREMPLALIMAAGKDRFDERRSEVFGG